MKRGKQISEKYYDVAPSHVCITCQYHDWDSMTMGTVVREQKFEKVTIKTHFCAAHAESAKANSKFLDALRSMREVA